MKFRGRVIEGQKLARTLGVPTANLSFSQRPKIKEGVWLVRVRFSEKEYGGVLHAGVRQTEERWTLEVHILDFSGELLDQVLEIETIQFVRDTMKFSALSALEAQIKSDLLIARKFFIREEIRSHWNMLSPEERERSALSAVTVMSGLPEFQLAQTVYVFAPDNTEIGFVQELCSRFPGKQFAFPYVRGWDMKFYISSYDDLSPGNLNILEPLPKNLAPKPDLILVPAVAAAKTGERLGRGGGFYDAFLSKMDVPTICILPEWAVVENIPFDARDQRVGRVIGV